MSRKQTWALAACTIAAITALAACSQMGVGYSQNESGRITPTESPVLQSESGIGDEKAREIALGHAGFKADDVTIVHEGRETSYGRLMHEVEFYTGTREFDYTVDAESGEIVAFDEDAEHYVIADWYRDTPPSTDSSAFIGDDAAKAAALADAGLAEGDVANMRIALDFDERTPRYEVEFDTEEKSYEYEVYALDGKVMSFQTERI